MHFWIDKRSQAFGYNGRARVAASLSTGNSNFGFSQPRRFPPRGKSMVTPVHRFPTVECTTSRHPQPASHGFSRLPTSQHASPSNFSGHHSSGSNSATYHPHSSPGGQYHHHASAANSYRIYNSHSPQAAPAIVQSAPDDATMISAITTRPQIAMVGVGGSSYDSQLLPSHLKFGLWASLALATIFVTSAKFYFDHQGTGVEVLIFCIFSLSFFFVACGVSVLRRPESRETISTAHTIQTQTEQLQHVEPPITPQTNYAEALAVIQASQPPPPYHIAILLPENSKEEIDESPPPSYDKIVI